MKIVITLDAHEILDLSTDAEIVAEIDAHIREANYYSLIQNHTVKIVR